MLLASRMPTSAAHTLDARSRRQALRALATQRIDCSRWRKFLEMPDAGSPATTGDAPRPPVRGRTARGAPSRTSTRSPRREWSPEGPSVPLRPAVRVSRRGRCRGGRRSGASEAGRGLGYRRPANPLRRGWGSGRSPVAGGRRGSTAGRSCREPTLPTASRAATARSAYSGSSQSSSPCHRKYVPREWRKAARKFSWIERSRPVGT